MRILKYRKTDRPRAVNRKRHADNRERVKLPVVRGDQVMVVRGDDKGKRGEDESALTGDEHGRPNEIERNDRR